MMTATEDQLRHELGNANAKADGLERLLETATEHIRRIAVPLPPEGSRRAALAFVDRIDDLANGKNPQKGTGAAPDEDALSGKRILVVEDEVYPGMSIRVILLGAGAEQVRLSNGIAGATAVLKGDFQPHAVILDLDIAGKDARPVARELADAGIPFVFHTGFADQDGLAAQFPNHRVLKKPAPADVLVNALKEAMQRAD
ncbi:MAG: hypothetical protein WA979_03595 [Pacificimonas sp.]